MGCCNTFRFKIHAYRTIEYYGEKKDKRLGDIFLVKFYQDSQYILKEINFTNQVKYKKRMKYFEKLHLKYPKLLVRIKGF